MIALALALALQGEAVVVAADAVQPHLAIGADGIVAVAFVRGGNVQVAVSTDKGKTFGAPFTALDNAGRARALHQRGPRIALDGKRIVVTAPLCFDEAEHAAGKPVNDLYAAVSSDGGKTFGKPVRLNDSPKTLAESIHAMTLSGGGDLHLAWLDKRSGKGLNLHTGRVRDLGKKVAQSSVAARDVCEECVPGLALDGSGRPVLAWREGGAKKNRAVFYATGDFAKPHRANTQETGLSTCPLDGPSVAVSRDGKTLALAWTDLRDPTSEGNVYWTVGPPGKLPEEVPAHDNRLYFQGHPSVAFDKNGVAWCAWEDGRTGFRQIYLADWPSKKNVALTPAAEGKCAFPSLAAGGGLLGVAYESGDNVAFRLLAGP